MVCSTQRRCPNLNLEEEDLYETSTGFDENKRCVICVSSPYQSAVTCPTSKKSSKSLPGIFIMTSNFRGLSQDFQERVLTIRHNLPRPLSPTFFWIFFNNSIITVYCPVKLNNAFSVPGTVSSSNGGFVWPCFVLVSLSVSLFNFEVYRDFVEN
jgi:hypothetical protein